MDSEIVSLENLEYFEVCHRPNLSIFDTFVKLLGFVKLYFLRD
jgi:hypothetical protein